MSDKTVITIPGVLRDLENGLTRTPKDKNYNPEVGCLKDKYSLSGVELKEIFKHPKLKGKKTIVLKERSYVLVEEEETISEEKDVTINIEENNKEIKVPETVVTEEQSNW